MSWHELGHIGLILLAWACGYICGRQDARKPHRMLRRLLG